MKTYIISYRNREGQVVLQSKIESFNIIHAEAMAKSLKKDLSLLNMGINGRTSVCRKKKARVYREIKPEINNLICRNNGFDMTENFFFTSSYGI